MRSPEDTYETHLKWLESQALKADPSHQQKGEEELRKTCLLLEELEEVDVLEEDRDCVLGLFCSDDFRGLGFSGAGFFVGLPSPGSA